MSTNEDDVARLVDRRTTSDGTKSHTQEVALRSTGPSRVYVHITYLPNGELSVKLRGWHEVTASGTRKGWPSGEMTLNHSEVENLRNLLSQELAVSEHSEHGEYMVVRLDAQLALGADGGQAVALQLARVLSRPDVVEHVNGVDVGDELLAALQGRVRLQELRSAVEELENHLEANHDDEAIYQAWCDKHPWAFGSAWLGRDQVRTIGVGDQVDELLKDTATGLRDVIELKRPSHKVLRYDNDHRSFFFSRDVSMAIGQCHRYLDVLHMDVSTRGLRDHPELASYHPRAVIVIGRSKGWPQEQLRALHGLNGRLHGVTIVTYDQLLAQGKRALDILRSESVSS